MDIALQLLFTGIGIGAVYALVALGFVLIFRATSVVNFAQGEFSMVAAYLMVVFAVDLTVLACVSDCNCGDGGARSGLQSDRLLSAASSHLSAGFDLDDRSFDLSLQQRARALRSATAGAAWLARYARLSSGTCLSR